MLLSKLLMLISVLVYKGSCLRILGLFPHHGKSHFDVFAPLLKRLSVKGHKVTVISYFPLKGKIPRYTDITLKQQDNNMMAPHSVFLDRNHGTKRYSYFSPSFIYLAGSDSCENVLPSKEMQDFLKQSQSYDVILIELGITHCFLSVAYKMNAPIVGITANVLMPWTADFFAIPDNPSYIMNYFVGYSGNLNFLERVENTLVMVYAKIFWFFMQIYDDRVVKKHVGGNLPPVEDIGYNVSLILVSAHFSLHRPRPLVPNVVEVGGLHIGEINALPPIYDDHVAKKYVGENLPSVEDIGYNISLILVNAHFSLHRPRPFGPNTVEVGGLHIGEIKALPPNIGKWINESTHGVIYFSLGSMIKGSSLQEEKRQFFLKAFSRLPQRVLWKWENDSMPGKTDNIMIQKWMPQLDILCHPNVKAFISHGGSLGTSEAVHCGVPVIAMPQFGDQFANTRGLEASGGGIVLDFRKLDEESVYSALKTVLDPSFNKRAKELSARFKDRPLPPLETAIYWIEYVARHDGAPHLRTAAQRMPLYQYLLLDVFVFLTAVIILVFLIIFYATKFIFRKMFSGSSHKFKTS